MSTPNVHAFLDKVNQDPALQERLALIPQPLDAASAQQLSDLAHEVGLALSAGDFITAAKTNELRDEELEPVAGGKGALRSWSGPSKKKDGEEESVSWWNRIFG